MFRTEIVGVRLTIEERRRLRALAERCARTESDLVRLLVLNLNDDEVSIGIPPLTLQDGGSLEAKASERELSAA